MSKRTPPVTVAVTERAAVQRLRRFLSKRGDQLLVDRNRDVYYIVSRDHTVTDANVDLEKVAKHLGVLRPWERIISEDTD